MNSYEDFPPEPYFISLLKKQPRAAWLYKSLWELKDKEQIVVLQKSDIRNRFFISPTLFKNLLLPIAEMGLISVDETPNMLIIELTAFDDEFNEQILI